MATRLTIGEGINYFHDFFSDFSGGKVMIHNKEYLAGQIAADTLNTPEDEMSALIADGDRLAERFNRMIREDLPVTPDRMGAMLRIIASMNDHLLRLPLYQALEIDMRLHKRLLHYYDSPARCVEVADKSSPEFGAVFNHVTFYAQVPRGVKQFVDAVTRLERERLTKLEERNAHSYAEAARLFFKSNPYASNEKPFQPEKAVGEFVPFFPIHMTYIYYTDPKEPGKTVLMERRFFDDLFAFLACDFYTGLQHGHAPMRCANCGRYFLNDKGYRGRKYCDGFDPAHPEYTCRQIGAERAEKESAEGSAPKRLCKKAKNKFRQACRDGAITEQERDRVLDEVERLQRKALRAKLSDVELEEALTSKAMYAKLKIKPHK